MNAGPKKKPSLRLARAAEAEARTPEVDSSDAILRDRFIDAAAHDLRTPLQVVGLHLHNLLEGKTAHLVDPEVKKRLLVMARHVDQLTRLSNRLVDVARADDAPLQLRLEPADLVALTSAALERMKEQLAWARCTVALSAKGPIEANVDVLRVDEVITALLLNAVKYAPGTAIAVSIKATAREAIVRIADKGPGIAPAVRDAIFKKYRRGSPVHGTSGLGLGLWLSRKVVVAHGGSLTLDERAKGATFVIRLPLAPEARQPS